jgi:hypothetical protein
MHFFFVLVQKNVFFCYFFPNNASIGVPTLPLGSNILSKAAKVGAVSSTCVRPSVSPAATPHP